VVLLNLPQIRTRLTGLVATPVMPTRTAVPVVLPPVVPTPIPPPPTATALPPPPPAPALVLAIGGFAQVVNTGGSGLRIRSTPSTTGKVLAKTSDGSRLQLKEGPRNDGKRDWWRVTGFDNKGTLGWCSA